MLSPAIEAHVVVADPQYPWRRRILRAVDHDAAVHGPALETLPVGTPLEHGSVHRTRVRVRVPEYDAGMDITTCAACGHSSQVPRPVRVVDFHPVHTMLLNADEYAADLHGEILEEIPAGVEPTA